jgi:hypothetical protein
MPELDADACWAGWPARTRLAGRADGRWERMPVLPDHSRANRAADGGTETRSGTQPPEPVTRPLEPVPPQHRPPAVRPGWGRLPAWAGVLMVVAAAALGAVVTVATHREPGSALGALVFAGTLAAATSVRARAAYAIIPVPALAYAVAAALSGYVHDRAADTTRAALAVSAVQWIADGFIAMAAATALAVLITLARWMLSRRRTR